MSLDESSISHACVRISIFAVLAALQACPLSRIKVVIVGQDPYHGAGQAHGLAFSVRRGFEGKFPPSLRNIINECAADLGPSKQFSKPRDKRLGDLSPWAKQGVLLLNACLTVRKGEANSHAGRGHEQLTDAIIQAVNSRAVCELGRRSNAFRSSVVLVCCSPTFPCGSPSRGRAPDASFFCGASPRLQSAPASMSRSIE